jgi:thioredoxin reductase (NADPH)
MSNEIHQVVIVGSGPAGYTAAVYAARANLKPVVFAGGPAESDPRRVPGGQLMITNDVENYPGFPTAVTGPELMEKFQKQAERFGTVIHLENVMQIDFSKRPFSIKSESRECVAHSIILATGASAKWLDVKGESTYANRGVSACATCDGFFFRNQDVLVVGGGDTAMEEATYLSKICNSVTVIHRRDSFRASKIMQERVLSNPKIKVLWNSAIEEIIGDAKAVTGARVVDVNTKTVSTLTAKAVFVAIGHVPATELFRGTLKLQDNGYLWVSPGTAKTSQVGVFACGDVCDSVYRQAVTAAGTGCMAAIEAERFLGEHGAH